MGNETPRNNSDGYCDHAFAATRDKRRTEIKKPAWDAIVLEAEDHVATALRHLHAGERARINLNEKESFVNVLEEIPLCHKIAVKTVFAGEVIAKYGYAIGRATSQIPAGSHVHIHNLASSHAQVQKRSSS